MLNVKYTNVFKKEVKLAKRRGKNLDKLQEIIQLLAEGRGINPRYCDHPLIGNYRGRRECHIEPDWLLIYKLEENNIIFERMGTHADLFK